MGKSGSGFVSSVSLKLLSASGLVSSLSNVCSMCLVMSIYVCKISLFRFCSPIFIVGLVSRISLLVLFMSHQSSTKLDDISRPFLSRLWLRIFVMSFRLVYSLVKNVFFRVLFSLLFVIVVCGYHERSNRNR